MTDWLAIDDIDYFEIELSNYCNAKCPACDRENPLINKATFNTNNISLAQIKKIIEQIPNTIKFYFGGTSGDPMMNPEIIQIFEYASKSVKNVSMDTNGSLRSPTVWKKLGMISKEFGSSITFSIDGLEDTNNIYRVNTNWKKIMNNAQIFIDAGGFADWKFLIFDHNKHQIEEAKALAKTMGFHTFVAEPSSRSNDFIKLTFVPVNKTRDYNLTVDSIGQINCRSLNTRYMYISSKLQLYPCCFFHSSLTEDISCDLNNTTLEAAINHIKYKKLRTSWKTNECPNTCKTHCNENKYWEKIISSEKL